MDQEEVVKLQDQALRHVFIRAACVDVLGSEDGPWVSLSAFSHEILVFTEIGQAPKIRILEIAQRDATFVLERLYSAGAEFIIDRRSRQLICTIQGVSATGNNYLEAGMRAYIKAFT